MDTILIKLLESVINRIVDRIEKRKGSIDYDRWQRVFNLLDYALEVIDREVLSRKDAKK